MDKFLLKYYLHIKNHFYSKLRTQKFLNLMIQVKKLLHNLSKLDQVHQDHLC
jgi:hypothetical protein